MALFSELSCEAGIIISILQRNLSKGECFDFSPTEQGWHLGPKDRTKQVLQISVGLWFWSGDQVGRKWFKATSFSILKVEMGREKTRAEEESILSPKGISRSEIDPTKPNH